MSVTEVSPPAVPPPKRPAATRSERMAANDSAPHTSALVNIRCAPSVNLAMCWSCVLAALHVTLIPSNVQFDAPETQKSPWTTGRSPGYATTRTGLAAVPVGAHLFGVRAPPRTHSVPPARRAYGARPSVRNGAARGPDAGVRSS